HHVTGCDASRSRLRCWVRLARRTTGGRRQRIGNQINAAFVFAWSDFASVRWLHILFTSSKSCPSPSPLLIHRPIYLGSVFPASSAHECLPLGRRKLHL